MPRLTPALISLPLLFAVALARAGEINVLTDIGSIGSPFPPGCVALALPDEPASSHPDDSIVRTVDAPSVGNSSLDSEVRVTIWRVGCPDDGHSIVMVRLEELSGEAVLVPQVFAEAGIVDQPQHEAQLITRPAVGNVGASGSFSVIPGDGITYMLAVKPINIQGDQDSSFWPEDYNDEFTLELSWADYSGNPNHFELFDVFAYNPDFDAPQFEQPVFHGRHTGNYRVNNHPRTGLMLQVAEFKRQGELAHENFIFAIFFTYTNEGEQLWITGNTGPEEPGPVSELELEMFAPEGGMFFTSPTGSFSSDDVDMVPVGTLTLRVVDCNNLEGDFDFSQGGFGSGSLEFQRLIRIAGYDCNPWE